MLVNSTDSGRDFKFTVPPPVVIPVPSLLQCARVGRKREKQREEKEKGRKGQQGRGGWAGGDERGSGRACVSQGGCWLFSVRHDLTQSCHGPFYTDLLHTSDSR